MHNALHHALIDHNNGRTKVNVCRGLFVVHWAGLPLAVVGPSILSKGVETGPTATQFGPACAQTLSPSPREDAAKWAYPLFL